MSYKLLTLILILTSFYSLAATKRPAHKKVPEPQNMVKLDGCGSGQCENFNFTSSKDDADQDRVTQSLGLNYARFINRNVALGATFIRKKKLIDGDITDANQDDNSTTIGASFYFNIKGRWSNTHWLAFHLNYINWPETDETQELQKITQSIVEFGYRFPLGSKMMGVLWHWCPSVTYYSNNVDEGDAKAEGTGYKINAANFAMVF